VSACWWRTLIWTYHIYLSFLLFRRFSQNCEKRLWVSSYLSAWNNSAFNGRIFMKFDIWDFFENLLRKFKFHYNMTRITGTLHDDIRICMIISLSVLLRMRKFSDKIVENIKTQILCSKTCFRQSCHLWENVEKYCPAGQATDGACALHYWYLRLQTHTQNV